MPHQELMVKFCQPLNYAGIFAAYGVGKTLTFLALADRLKWKRILVVSSKTSIESTWPEEVRKFTNHKYVLLTGTPKYKVNALELGMRYTTGVYAKTVNFLINFDGIRNIYDYLYQVDWDAIVVDECFVAGTSIETLEGKKKIEGIKNGDVVYTAIGPKKVIRTASREVYKLVKLKLSNGEEIVCTPEHPIFTNEGWVASKDCLDKIVYDRKEVGEIVNEKTSKTEMRMVWEDFCSQRCVSSKTILQSILFSEVENETTGSPKESVYKRARQKSKQSIDREKKTVSCMECGNTDEGGISEKVKQYIEENWTQTPYAGRKWKTHIKMAENVVRKIVKGLEIRVSNYYKSKRFEKVFSKLFKNRYSKPQKEDWNRSGWVQPFELESSKIGSKKRKEIRVIGVENISSEEYRNSREFSTSIKKSETVYNLQLEGHPSFFANGILVHNSTKVKSPKALRTKILWALGRKAKKRFIMTGWPITENIAEIYSQVKFLDFGKAFGNSYYAFLDKHFIKTGFKRIPKKKSAENIFKAIKPFCIRVENDVIKLPPQVYKKEALIPTKQQSELLNNFKSFFQLEFGKVKINTDSIFTLLNKSLQICDGFVQDTWHQKIDDKVLKCKKCGTKYSREYGIKTYCPRCRYEGSIEPIHTSKDEALFDVLDDVDIKKNKILIWANYRWTVSKIKTLIGKEGHKVLTLTGATENVNKVIKTFQNDKSYNVLIATQKKASESITLTNCRYNLYYGNNWSADLRGNSEARTRRKGSEKHESIVYIDFYLKGTVEAQVIECLQGKKNMLNTLKGYFASVEKKL